jgi:hypothetical protein
LPSPGNSTPIIWGDRVFLTQATDVTMWPPKVPENFAGGNESPRPLNEPKALDVYY